MTHVLVVNDDPTIRSLMHDVLEAEGYDVSVVNDGQQALTLLRATRVHLVILVDDLMPVMSGIDLMRELAQNATLLCRHAYICTGWRMWPVEDVRKALGIPAHQPFFRVSVPCTVDDLLLVVQQAAQQLERLQRLH